MRTSACRSTSTRAATSWLRRTSIASTSVTGFEPLTQGITMPLVPIRFPILGAVIAGCLAADEAASYSLGIAFATEWKEGELTDALSEAALVRGIHDALGGKPRPASQPGRQCTGRG